MVRGKVRKLLRELRAFPGQFWVLVGGILFYCAAAGLAFPFEGIYMRTRLGASMTAIGIVFGLVPLVVMPLQIWGGHLTDRFGRRGMIALAAASGGIWFCGFAFVTEIWQVAVLVAIECTFGWPLFQTASNAMVADLVEPGRRTEAYSISRVAMNVGVVLGPAAAGIALGLGVSFRALFLSAAAGCLAFGVITVVLIRESRPESAREPQKHTDERGRSGYRIVFADWRFLAFCGVALLPVFCFGQFGSIYSVYITDFLHVPYRTWGLLLAMNAGIVACVQYPLIRKLKRRDPMILLSIASLLIALGLGGSAFAVPLWPLVLLVIVMSMGEILLAPVTATVVSNMAPEAVRGRYMGVWTVTWNGGASLGPLVGGVAMDKLGAREAFVLVLIAGLAGAALFPLLRSGRRPRRRVLRRLRVEP